MSGTLIITGATGSLALEVVRQLRSSPYIVVGTVRKAKQIPQTPQLLQLDQLKSQYTPGQLQTKEVDLNSLAEVRSFANSIASQIESGDLPPLSAIICNAFTWSLDKQHFSEDGYESTFQVGHLAHFLLVLMLVQCMHESGRIVMLGSEVHNPEHHNALAELGAQIPSDMNLLVKPALDDVGTEYDMGWRRYANCKLANVMFMRSLNQRLEKDPKLSKITVMAMDPGGIVDSRAHLVQRSSTRFMFGLIAILMPLLRPFTSSVRLSSDSARDLVTLAVDPEYHSSRGYFAGTKAIMAASVTENEDAREGLWAACWKWAVISGKETCIMKSLV
ncbi:hypothetical protein N7495_008949 [Penicillium taxi]|uniref:uncharacterized protein n=1 Tax=Penicillium taxi TaxID=168475 RepID=UPI0025453226|nr:uncharacterized protein N7495_008949 [Penicillium taxi]KAJ5888908.1 hypothetical protein N7495_008949 [Penicillium taxi]